MAVREVRVYPDPVLKTVCETIDRNDKDINSLAQDIIDTMIAAGHSVGVAAPQIGVTKRMAVVDVSKSKLGKDNHHGLLVMVNPEILKRSGRKTMREGCMSVPDYTGNVTRAEQIVLQFSDCQGKARVIEASGFEAVAIQHEIDHLDGYLFIDRVSNPRTDVFPRKKK